MVDSPRSPIRLLAGRDLALGPSAERFLGREYGVNVSFFINHTPPGHVTGPHVHPYPEVFAIHSGEMEFTVDGTPLRARGGEVVVVPAGAVHGFRNDGAERVEMVSIHPAAEMTTDWLEQQA